MFVYVFFCIDLWVVVFSSSFCQNWKCDLFFEYICRSRKDFPLKKKHRRKRKTFEQNSLKPSSNSQKFPSQFCCLIFLDPKKKTCFFESSRVVVLVFRCPFFFWRCLVQQNSLIGWKKNNHRKIWVDVVPVARCVSFEGLQSPIQTPEWSCQAGFSEGSLAATHMVQVFFGWSTSPEAYWENVLGPGVGHNKTLEVYVQVKFVKIVDFRFCFLNT